MRPVVKMFAGRQGSAVVALVFGDLAAVEVFSVDALFQVLTELYREPCIQLPAQELAGQDDCWFESDFQRRASAFDPLLTAKQLAGELAKAHAGRSSLVITGDPSLARALRVPVNITIGSTHTCGKTTTTHFGVLAREKTLECRLWDPVCVGTTPCQFKLTMVVNDRMHAQKLAAQLHIAYRF